MASLADTLVSKVLGHSAAEKAFRPWWDNFEEKLIYGLLTLGKAKMCFRAVTFSKWDKNLCHGQNMTFGSRKRLVKEFLKNLSFVTEM